MKRDQNFIRSETLSSSGITIDMTQCDRYVLGCLPSRDISVKSF